MYTEALAPHQLVRLPDRDGGQLQFVRGSFEFAPDLSTQLFRSLDGPDPDVGVEQQSHLRTVHRLKAPTGSVMLPRISAEPLAQPSHEGRASGFGDTTSATGRPKRVTRTSSRTDKQVALNLEMAISRISHFYHGPRLWSEL